MIQWFSVLCVMGLNNKLEMIVKGIRCGQIQAMRQLEDNYEQLQNTQS
jgi:hypothetical protein